MFSMFLEMNNLLPKTFYAQLLFVKYLSKGTEERGGKFFLYVKKLGKTGKTMNNLPETRESIILGNGV